MLYLDVRLPAHIPLSFLISQRNNRLLSLTLCHRKFLASIPKSSVVFYTNWISVSLFLNGRLERKNEKKASAKKVIPLSSDLFKSLVFFRLYYLFVVETVCLLACLTNPHAKVSFANDKKHKLFARLIFVEFKLVSSSLFKNLLLILGTVVSLVFPTYTPKNEMTRI